MWCEGWRWGGAGDLACGGAADGGVEGRLAVPRPPRDRSPAIHQHPDALPHITTQSLAWLCGDLDAPVERRREERPLAVQTDPVCIGARVQQAKHNILSPLTLLVLKAVPSHAIDVPRDPAPRTIPSSGQKAPLWAFCPLSLGQLSVQILTFSARLDRFFSASPFLRARLLHHDIWKKSIIAV